MFWIFLPDQGEDQQVLHATNDDCSWKAFVQCGISRGSVSWVI